jgi:hypothetical protein
LANNPIFFEDKYGDTVGVNVTNKAVGYAMINLYSGDEVKRGKIQETVRVPVYKVTVSNESGSSSEFLYTRYNLRANISENDRIEDRTFDINHGNFKFSGVVKSRWSGVNNVLEVRSFNPPADNVQGGVIGMRGDIPDVERVAIQFHVLGASDGCLLAVGANGLMASTGITAKYATSAKAQEAFMSTIMKYRDDDAANKYSKVISITFDRLHNNAYYKQEIRGTINNIPVAMPLPIESSLEGIKIK